jgi:hypothetical protein
MAACGQAVRGPNGASSPPSTVPAPPPRPLKEFKPRRYTGPIPSNVPEPKPRNPADYTHEENLAFFHEQARLQAEKRQREIEAFFAENDRDEEEDSGRPGAGYW